MCMSMTEGNLMNLFTIRNGNIPYVVQNERWREVDKGEWMGVLGDRVWKLKQNSEEILYQVCGRREPCQDDTVKRESQEDGEVRGDEKGKTGKQKKSQGNSAIITRTNFDQKAVFKDEKGVKLEYNGCVDTSHSTDEAVLREYFQLSINLSDLYKTWAQADPNFEKISKQFEGIRILRQEPVECLFAFICSSNNNISRISSMVEKLALHYGEKIAEVDGIPYHAFPAVSALAGDGVEQKLRSLGFGYRAKYIQQSAKFIEENGGEEWLYCLRDKKYKESKTELMKLCGVGAKVADCVGLFCLDKTGSIPVDTHVWQIAARDYMPKLKQAKSLTDKLYDEIGDYFRDLWGPYAGWAHSVLFTADLRRFREDAEKAKLSASKRQSAADIGDNKEQTKKVKKKKRYILSVEDEEIIESQTTSRDKVHRLIDILLERLPQGFDELVKSLIEGRTQTHLANMLNEEFEIKRRNCYANMNHVNGTQTSSSFISDLGVDTTKLPKPQLPKNFKKDNDSKSDPEKDIS